jgi:hypothetical protein
MRYFFKQIENGEIDLAYVQRQLKTQRLLNYFKIKRLGASHWETSKRNVVLQQPDADHFLEHFGGNLYAWKHARMLESRQHVSLFEGCYGLSQKRAERFVGALPKDDFGDFDDIASVSLEKQRYAKQFRTFAYFPIFDSASFVELLSLHGTAECAVYISSDWYDPPSGVIPMPNSQTIWCGTHSFTPNYDVASKQFHFDNTWGREWGDMGCGRFDLEYFENHATEMIGHAGFIDFYKMESDFDVCVGWKWSLSEKFSIHAREIIEGKSGDRIAWAFCTRIGSELVVHEFFVWPTFRCRGFGSKLADEIKLLSKETGLALRLRVPFVDCVGSNLDGVVAVGRMLGVELRESTSRFYSLDGVLSGNATQEPKINREPPPPAASPLEWLRRPKELPLEEEIGVPVFFGTNRNSVLTGECVTFGNERGCDLSCGFKVVQVKDIQRFGSAGRHWFNSLKDFLVWFRGRFAELDKDESRVNLLEKDSFASLSQFLASTKEEPNHLVYVHGFNTTFEFAMKQAARLKADLKLNGNVFLYSWPSAGKVASYSYDEATVEASFPHFVKFMELVEDSISGEPLSVLAHSMGNRLLTKFIDYRTISKAKRRLNNAIFAAPDVDHDVFVHCLRSWKVAFDRATLYANSADLALQLSEIKHMYSRAGLIPPVVKVEDLETILVQGFDLFELAHGYFAQAGNTLHDIFVLIKFNSSASDRPGTRPLTLPSTSGCWSISHF